MKWPTCFMSQLAKANPFSILVYIFLWSTCSFPFGISWYEQTLDIKKNKFSHEHIRTVNTRQKQCGTYVTISYITWATYTVGYWQPPVRGYYISILGYHSQSKVWETRVWTRSECGHRKYPLDKLSSSGWCDVIVQKKRVVAPGETFKLSSPHSFCSFKNLSLSLFSTHATSNFLLCASLPSPSYSLSSSFFAPSIGFFMTQYLPFPQILSIYSLLCFSIHLVFVLS